MPCDNKMDERSERSNSSTNDNAASSRMSSEVYQSGGKLDVPRDSSSSSAHGMLPELSIVDSSAKQGATSGGDKPGSGQSSGDGKQLSDSGATKNSSTDSMSQNSSIDSLNATVNKFEKDITQAVETLGSEIQSFTNKMSQILEPYNSQNPQNVQSPQNSYLNDWMGQPSQGGDWSSRMAAQGFQPGAFDNSNQNFMQQFAASGMTPQNFNFNSSMESQLSGANDGPTGAAQSGFQPGNSFNAASMATLSGTPGDGQSSDSQATAANSLRSNLSAWAGVTMSALNAFSPMQGGSNNQFSSDVAPMARGGR